MKICNISKNNIAKVKCFATIDDFVIKDKPIQTLSPKTEQKIINHMQEFAEQRTIKEFKAIKSAQRIFLNA